MLDAPHRRRHYAARLLSAALLLAGLDSAGGARDTGYTLSLEPVADNLTHPVVLAEPPDGSGRLFIADQDGEIWIITPEGQRRKEPFLSLKSRLVKLSAGYDERGLLGLAFHPDYAENGRFFVFYSAPLRPAAPEKFDHTNRVSAFRVSSTDPNVADAGSEQILLAIDHPYMNHNAGALAFGPDGFLYIALGDGGNRDDQDRDLINGHAQDWYAVNSGGNGQDIENNLLGSILRIDVDTGQQAGEGGRTAYRVPGDNPFTNIPGVKSEIWAYGLRNPYRFSFDRNGGREIIVGDAGQNLYEEVSVVRRGGNYGWNVMEARHCFNAASPTNPFESCPQQTGTNAPIAGDPLRLPVIEAKNSGYFPQDGIGLVIVGGYIYRGDRLPEPFRGRYLFGSWSAGHGGDSPLDHHQPGRLFIATRKSTQRWPFEDLRLTGRPDGRMDSFLLSFGQDRRGELYLLTAKTVGPTGTTGSVYRLVPAR